MVNEKDYLLTNQEILGGIKAAIARGEELKDAMMTFYQAGYDKTEIEEAAKSYIEMLNPATAQSQMPLSKKERRAKEKERKKKEKEEKKGKVKEGKNPKEKKLVHSATKPLGSAAPSKPVKETKQKISKYDTPKNKPAKPPGGKAITIVLILVLLLLLGMY